MPVVELITELVVEGGIAGITAQTGKKTGKLSVAVEARALEQIASGTAIPIPSDRLAAFERATVGPLTGRARQFAFIGAGSTLTIAQRVALGLVEAGGNFPTFSPHFSLFRSSRSVPLGQLVGRSLGGPSLSERLRTRDGNSGLTLQYRRPDWPELFGQRATA